MESPSWIAAPIIAILLVLVTLTLLDLVNRYRSKLSGPTFLHWMFNYVARGAHSGNASILKYFKHYGDSWAVQIAGQQLVFTQDAEISFHVLQAPLEHYRKPADEAGILRVIAGNGVLMSEGSAWARLRLAAVAPAKALRAFDGEQSFVREIGNICQEVFCTWTKLAQSDSVVDMHRELTNVAFACMTRAAFGIKGNATALAGDFELLLDEMSRPMRRYISFFQKLPFSANVTVSQSLFRIRQAVIERLDQQTPNVALDALRGIDKPGGLALNDVELQDTILTFLLAGHETTASVLTFALHLLTTNPQCLHTAIAEVDMVLGQFDGVWTAAVVRELKYLRLVIMETLRLYPPAAIIARSASRDDRLPGAVTLKSGSLVLVCVYAMHRSLAYWENPNEFDPTRFARPFNRHAFVPFSSGRRRCIGEDLAVTEAVVIIASILKKFSFVSLTTELEVEQRATLRPRGGLPMKLVLR